MSSVRVLVIALCGIALVAASAMYALACSVGGFPEVSIELQSLTIDGVTQTELTKYKERLFYITPSRFNDHPDAILFSSGSGGGEIYDPK